MRHLVTGATGLVGSRVVDRLLARGDRVRALVLEPEAVAGLQRRGVDVRPGDLSATADLAPATDGVDTVIHCAGVVQASARTTLSWPVMPR